MRFSVKILQRHPHRTSNEKDDMIDGMKIVDIEDVVATVYKLLYGLGVEVRVEVIED
jgi:hypothetical protein